MAGSFGYRFIFFTLVFYLFLGIILTQGAGDWLTSTIDTPLSNFTVTNYTTNGTQTSDVWSTTRYILQNPFSGISWLAWLSLTFLLTDIYIIVTSLIP